MWPVGVWLQWLILRLTASGRFAHNGMKIVSGVWLQWLILRLTASGRFAHNGL